MKTVSCRRHVFVRLLYFHRLLPRAEANKHSWFISSQSYVSFVLIMHLICEQTPLIYPTCSWSWLSSLCAAEEFFKEQKQSCAAALPTQQISVSISDHNHNSGPMMSIATVALMNEESIVPEQCLPSHQFNLSLSTLQARGPFLKKYFSCHQAKERFSVILTNYLVLILI